MNKNPNTIILLQEDFDINKFTGNIKNEWNKDIKLDVIDKDGFISYAFKYNNMEIAMSYFNTKYFDDISFAFERSRYSEKSPEVYKNHTKFCMVTAFKGCEQNTNKGYRDYTEIIMAFLKCLNKECSIFDCGSEQFIDKETYLSEYENVKEAHNSGIERFPINFYVNFFYFRDKDIFISFTQGFENFNDYEIEIATNKISGQQIAKIMNFVVLNVIVRQDKIKNAELIPVPLEKGFGEAIIKQAKSRFLNKEVLHLFI